MKEESEKAGLKLNIQKMKIIASGPITSCQIDGEKMGIVTDFIFLSSRITVTAAMKWKKCLLLGRKAMTNLDSVLKSRDINLLTKVHIVKAMVFPVVIYRYESWTIKKTEHHRTDGFKLWCWIKFLRVPWTAWRSNQSNLKESNPKYSLEGLVLKLQYFGTDTWYKELTHWKRPWCWEGLRSGGEGDDRVWDCWMAWPTQHTWVWANSGR